LDCTAFGGTDNEGVCYMLADTVLAYESAFSSLAAGVVWGPEQEMQWNLADNPNLS